MAVEDGDARGHAPRAGTWTRSTRLRDGGAPRRSTAARGAFFRLCLAFSADAGFDGQAKTQVQDVAKEWERPAEGQHAIAMEDSLPEALLPEALQLVAQPVVRLFVCVLR